MTVALSYPVPFQQFWNDGHAFLGATFYLQDNMTQSITRGGEVINASRGARLWQGQVSFDKRIADLARRADAILSEVREPGATFFAYPKDRAFPVDDPDGSILGSATPLISSVSANGKDIGISGLPPNYHLSQGDFLSFTRDGNPVRYDLHMVVRGRYSDENGDIPQIQLTPWLRPGVKVATPVTLIRPFCKCVYMPNSYAPANFARIHGEGLGFSFVQTFG